MDLTAKSVRDTATIAKLSGLLIAVLSLASSRVILCVPDSLLDDIRAALRDCGAIPKG